MASGIQKRSSQTSRGMARDMMLCAKHIAATPPRTFTVPRCMKLP
jgi:hypothetical protein